MTIAVDFDGTIVEHRYPRIGEEIPFAVETLKLLQHAHGTILEIKFCHCCSRLFLEDSYQNMIAYSRAQCNFCLAAFEQGNNRLSILSKREGVSFALLIAGYINVIIPLKGCKKYPVHTRTNPLKRRK